MIPAIKTPNNTEITALAGFIPRRKEAIEPVQAPVKGRGMAIKIINPNTLYLSIKLLLDLVCLKSQLKNLSKILNLLLRKSDIGPKRNIISIGGIILPIYDNKKDIPKGILYTNKASGRDNLSSPTGVIARKKTVKY